MGGGDEWVLRLGMLGLVGVVWCEGWRCGQVLELHGAPDDGDKTSIATSVKGRFLIHTKCTLDHCITRTRFSSHSVHYAGLLICKTLLLHSHITSVIEKELILSHPQTSTPSSTSSSAPPKGLPLPATHR